MPSNFLLDGFSKVFNPILDPVFGILLKLDPLFSIIIITVIITLISTLIYKKMTDQEVLKSLKAEMKDIRKDMKEFKHDVKKMEELQKRSLEKSMTQFKHSMKPMFITMIPILIIFGWFYSHLAYNPILPNQDFTTSVYFTKAVEKEVELIVPEEIELISNAKQKADHYEKQGWIFTHHIYFANWTLKGDPGEYVLTYAYAGQEYTKDVLITEERKYKSPQKTISGSDIREIKIDNQEIRIFGLRWFWVYFIFAVIFNSLLRKLLKVH